MNSRGSIKYVSGVLSIMLLLSSVLLYTGSNDGKGLDKSPDISTMLNDPVPVCEKFCERYKNEIDFMICMFGCKGAAEMVKKERDRN